MIKQKLLALLTTIGLCFMISCGGVAIKRPAFANEESVVGQDITKVVERFGPPHGSGSCAVPLPMGMDNMKMVKGDAVFWVLKDSDTALRLAVCVINDYIVSEKKTVLVFRKGVLSQNMRETIDYKALADALERGLQKENPKNKDTIREYLHKKGEIEI